MTDFTKLLERGHQRYIAKYMKKREFGNCNSCDKITLLLKYIDPKDESVEWDVCEDCFTLLQKDIL